MTIKEQVRAIGEAFVYGLRRILGDKLYGLYIYGRGAPPLAVGRDSCSSRSDYRLQTGPYGRLSERPRP
jgi:hypothetical protein